MRGSSASCAPLLSVTYVDSYVVAHRTYLLADLIHICLDSNIGKVTIVKFHREVPSRSGWPPSHSPHSVPKNYWAPQWPSRYSGIALSGTNERKERERGTPKTNSNATNLRSCVASVVIYSDPM